MEKREKMSEHKSAIGMYVVYENYPNKYARIHLVTCSEYLNRKANVTSTFKGHKTGEWWGPYETYEEAIDAASYTGKRVSKCSKCMLKMRKRMSVG